ncbi:DUF4145 domain-containing protein [Streptomyces sp. NPDC051665]|uniref:DUF4145 domain-containing protein n=1 Tax=Streptomyces sp. NPDC051665 TaxID=3154647 RepID=UPI00341C1988
MATTNCGWCDVLTHMIPSSQDPIRVPNPAGYGDPVFMSTFQCSNEHCSRYSIGYTTSRSQYLSREQFIVMPMEWEPANVRRPNFPDVPDRIAETASEAHVCLSVGAARGAVALARAVVEATAKEKSITTGSLMQKIDEMANRGIIRELTKETAHAIRDGGNEIAHGDITNDPMPLEDATAIVEFMDSLLEEVFQHPAKLNRLRQSHQSRKNP